jgi:exonuclease SbcC
VQLDAPIVLIHGQNGAGKTSILSAIELGLTGVVQSLSRGDTDYITHLPHKSGNQGRVALTVDGLDGQSQTADLIVTSGGIQNGHLLGMELSRFFTERCYLAQSTLGRLLEIYQHQERKSDSALTKFVKDLLGLDQLEALIDGLHSAGDVRRLRLLAPSYWDATKNMIPEIEGESIKLTAEWTQLEKTIVTLRLQVHQYFAARHPDNLGAATTPEAALQFVLGDQEEAQLQLIARARRDLQASAAQWSLLVQNTQSVERASVEAKEGETRVALEAWRLVTGEVLEAIHQELKFIFPEIPSPSVGDPELARSVAHQAIDKELQRYTALLARDATDVSRLSELEQSIKQGKARTSELDTQIAESAGLTTGLAQLLAQLVPHIHTEDCPVCGRDYSEISSSQLQAHISDRIASLTVQAGRLQALATDKARTAGLVTAAERERAETLNRKLIPELRDQLKTRRARFEELKAKLQGLESATVEGVALQRRASMALQRLSDFRSRDERSTSLRLSVGEIAQKLGQPVPDTVEPLEAVLGRLLEYTETQERLTLDRQRARRVVNDDIKAWQSAETRRTELNELITRIKNRLQQLQTSKAEADGRLELAKDLGRQAREARAAIVRRVFNEELNKVWSDLFIRLAPEEPFVPAFALPNKSGGSVEAILETLYRAGGKGGNPLTMLSAGNLNTAALTLFLSLHLSVRPSLPWLIIDDPVQSMDEVHISQFAALLRTLAKQHGRQLVIAVHERQLFEYLALELSPAFPDDRLITIELGRTANGMTTAVYEPKIYIPDRAIAA